MTQQIAGWLGVTLLAASLTRQLVHEGRSRSVVAQCWLPLLGRLVAAGTLAVYALLEHDPVFLTASLLVVVAGLASHWIGRRKRQRWCRTIPTRRSDVIPFHPRRVLLKRQGGAR